MNQEMKIALYVVLFIIVAIIVICLVIIAVTFLIGGIFEIICRRDDRRRNQSALGVTMTKKQAWKNVAMWVAKYLLQVIALYITINVIEKAFGGIVARFTIILGFAAYISYHLYRDKYH